MKSNKSAPLLRQASPRAAASEGSGSDSEDAGKKKWSGVKKGLSKGAFVGGIKSFSHRQRRRNFLASLQPVRKRETTQRTEALGEIKRAHHRAKKGVRASALECLPQVSEYCMIHKCD